MIVFAAQPAAEDRMEVEEEVNEVPLEPVDEIVKAKAAELVKTRREKFKSQPESLAAADDFKSYEELSSNPLHLSSKPGILCVDTHQQQSELV